MNTRQRERGFKYTDDFERQLVSENHTDGASIPMVSKRPRLACKIRNDGCQHDV
ncbi:MAG: hypothetical protein P8Q92_00160 [Pseudoprimorskyibacter sp.]|nr:hypothetical protein [Pseudoprimorskyibacter sp.]